MKAILIGVATLIAVGKAATGAWAADPSVDALIAANRGAVGEAPLHSAVTLVYRYVGAGLSGTRTDQIDLTTGAFVETTDAGGVTEANGFDGSIPWQRDVSGTYTPQQGGDRIPAAIDLAYRRANRWWLPAHGHASIARLADEAEGEQLREHLSVTPAGGERFDVWLDARTHLQVRTSYDDEFMHVTETYTDYRREGPQILPHTIAIDPGQGPGAVTTLTLVNCDYQRAAPLSAYSEPKIPLTGADIDGGASAATVPFRLLNNHVYVDATVNGHGPFTFIVDTGGHTLLSPHLIKQVGLKAIGEAVTSGAGEGHGTSGFVRYGEIAIGSLRMHDQVAFATDIYDKAIEGIAVDGMVGFELIRRMVTTIDYGHRTITFVSPDNFRPKRDTGSAVPFVFYDHVPNVSGRIEDLPARFDIDTGSRSALDVTTPFVRRHQLHDRFPTAPLAVTGFGVGGPARSYVVRLQEVTIGDVRVANPVVDLSDAHGGSFSDPNFDANVGSGLLKGFVVTFDYARQIMYLRRIEPAPTDFGTFDRSGLWINAHGDGYEVADIARDSAGSRAGIVIGDLIVAADGHPLADAGLSDFRQELRSAPTGTRIGLTVRRGSETREVALILRDQLDPLPLAP